LDIKEFELKRDAIQAGQLWAAMRDEPIEHLSKPDYLRLLSRNADSMFGRSERLDSSLADELFVRAAMSNAAIVETFSTVIGNKLIEAAKGEPDTTQGWVYETSAANFLPATIFTLEHASRLERSKRGETAKQTSFGTKGEPWAIARYAAQFVLDEQNMLDGQTVGATMLAAAQHGAAAARLRPDLIYALLLANPTLTADNVALFHSTHSNKGTGGGSALAAASLDTAIAAIGKQYLTAEPDSYPVHSNLQARYLMVPPDLVGAARRAVRNMVLGDGNDIEVRQESRLSSVGVVDPKTGTVYSGSATAWLLTAPAGSRPTLAVGGLDGNLTPQIRRFMLDKGQWGVGWDVVCDLGAIALDYRGAYYSVGA
jgi:hypothetical protein